MSLANERKELHAAADGLEQWFKSQDIEPVDALFVVANLFVRQTVANASRKPDSLVGLQLLRSYPTIVAAAFQNEMSFVVREELQRLGRELGIPLEVLDKIAKAIKP